MSENTDSNPNSSRDQTKKEFFKAFAIVISSHETHSEENIYSFENKSKTVFHLIISFSYQNVRTFGKHSNEKYSQN